jgi:hypothetical protein
MKQIIASKPLVIALVSLGALCGGCARDGGPPRTAVVERSAQPAPSSAPGVAIVRTSSVGVTERQGEARGGSAFEARPTLDLSGIGGDAPAPGTSNADADVARSVRHALLGDALLENCPALQVSASNGKVRLEGAVGSALEHLSAVTDAVSVPGVVEVDDQLSVVQPPEGAEQANAAMDVGAPSRPAPKR